MTPSVNMKALVGAFNQEKALVGAFSVIVQLHRLIIFTAQDVTLDPAQPPPRAVDASAL